VMKWVVEAGSSTPEHPLYRAKDDHVTHWTVLIEIAKRFDSEDEARRYASKHRLVAPRFKSIAG
jgi:hypothetical protein